MPRRTLTTNEFIKKSQQVHGDYYNYDKTVYINAKTKVIITCPKHGDFSVLPNSHKSGYKCRMCGFENRVLPQKLSHVDFIIRAKNMHNDKYDYSKTEYTTMANKVTITCPKHGDFSLLASNHVKKYKKQGWQHLNPAGCPQCGKEHTIARNKMGQKSQSQFIIDSKAVHDEKYDYSKVQYVGCRQKIEIICNTHGSFFQIASNHLRGSGCPKCKNSKGQRKVSRVLTSMGIKFIDEHFYDDCIGDKSPLYFDFYIPSKNILIEYDGEQHFKPVKFHSNMTEETIQMMFEKTQRYDKIKNEYTAGNNIPLLRIAYTEFNNIEKIIRNYLY